MIEGWHQQDYLVLFDESDVADLTRRYDLHSYLADHDIVGLRGWDDFILRDRDGRLLTVPTVPIDPKYLAPLAVAIDLQGIQVDERFRGKIKWYVKPVFFGGDPSSQSNITWISLDLHIDAVRWWNRKYREIAER